MVKKNFNKEVEDFLEFLNKKYYNLHKKYEDLFWKVYMGQGDLNDKMTEALKKRDEFAANEKYAGQVKEMLTTIKLKKLKERLGYWNLYFSKNQTPKNVLEIRNEISLLENKISEKIKAIEEGYIDPKTKKFVKMPYLQMRYQMTTNNDEKMRKAFFESSEKRAETVLEELVELVSLRNKFANELGYEDFYAYKVENNEGMTKKELFSIFDNIYEKTKYAFQDIRELEKTKKGLRKPWNYAYMFSGDFIKDSDKYLQFEDILEWWGESFTALGIDYDNGELKLDLLERKNKYNNGFCHWPKLVKYENGKKIPALSNFTCNSVIGQVGAGNEALITLFHEGGHAAHLLNSTMQDVCINHEYPPQTAAWMETQSMFLDAISSSIEWKTRYAKDKDGNSYPFELFENMINQNYKLIPFAMMGVSSVMYFERDLYEDKSLNVKKVKEIAKKNSKKFGDMSVISLGLLNISHIYSFESACSYHGYGLAKIALVQWREYFYKKYDYIVDNKNVGKEMKRVWKQASAKTFSEFIKEATGEKLSSKSYIKKITQGKEKILSEARKRIKRLSKVKKNNKIDLKANISLWHGTKKIADNKKGFREMVRKYNSWIDKNFN